MSRCTSYDTTITFTNDDLLLVSKPHNHPLPVTSYIWEQKVKLVLMDRGLTIGIMPRSMMNDLGIMIK